jgi:uncharacterized protein GlcG (DUF336 family)
MKHRWSVHLAGAVLALPMMLVPALGQSLPGDNGRMMGGIFPANLPPMPPGGGGMPQQAKVPAPPITMALQAAQAIAEGCKQYGLGVAVVDAKGEPRLVYIPDQSQSDHAYTAIRKAYTAVTFKVRTETLVVKAQTDPVFAAKIKADPNLMAFKGGIPLFKGGQLIGAIGVSGAEPGGHDDECGMIGYNAIQSQLQ